MIRLPASSVSRTQRSGSPIAATSSSIGLTYAGAPPWSGPESAPTAAESAAPQLLGSLVARHPVRLAEPPLTGKARGLGLQVGGRVPGQRGRLVRLRLRHRRVKVVVDEQPPDLFIRVMPDELLDVHAAIAK